MAFEPVWEQGGNFKHPQPLELESRLWSSSRDAVGDRARCAAATAPFASLPRIVVCLEEASFSAARINAALIAYSRRVDVLCFLVGLLVGFRAVEKACRVQGDRELASRVVEVGCLGPCW